MVLRCPSCGSPGDVGTAVCTLCGTVLAEPVSEGDTQALKAGFEGLSVLVPEFIVPFRVGREQASQIFGDWSRKGLFTPRARRVDRLQGIYFPFWMFSMRADSTWEADIGEWWSEDGTERRHTEWHPLRGRHHSHHSHFLVSGAHGLPREEALAVGPFELQEMRRHGPHDLAGWLIEPCSVAREEALARCQRALQEAEEESIRAFLPGDSQAGLEWTTTFSEVAGDLVLLPFWIGTCSYRGKPYRYVLNGQTGRITGIRPVSPVRVGLLIAALLLALLVIVLLALGGAR